MHIITTAQEALVLCNQPINSELSALLHRYAAILEDFEHDLDAMVIVVEAGDCAMKVQNACAYSIVAEERFVFPVEVATRHRHWFEVVWIAGDDGAGLVLLIEIAAGTDPTLLTACRRASDERAA